MKPLSEEQVEQWVTDAAQKELQHIFDNSKGYTRSYCIKVARKNGWDDMADELSEMQEREADIPYLETLGTVSFNRRHFSMIS